MIRRAASGTRTSSISAAKLQAFLHPEQSTQIEVVTPPENAHRIVWMYTDIDKAVMAEDCWRRLMRYE